jgi:hypothetical protein
MAAILARTNVMAGLDPAIHAFAGEGGVDHRVEPGDDD